MIGWLLEWQQNFGLHGDYETFYSHAYFIANCFWCMHDFVMVLILNKIHCMASCPSLHYDYIIYSSPTDSTDISYNYSLA